MIPLRLLEVFIFTKEWVTIQKTTLMKCFWTLGKNNRECRTGQY